jgi:ribonuclease E
MADDDEIFEEDDSFGDKSGFDDPDEVDDDDLDDLDEDDEDDDDDDD